LLVGFWLPHPSGESGPGTLSVTSLEALQARYGPEKFSQGPEEWILRQILHDRRNGTFVDVGAFEPIKYSNTYRLERDLGWSGVAVDALEELAPKYTGTRPHTKFVAAFVGTEDTGTTTLHVSPDAPEVSSAVQRFTSLFAQNKTEVPRQVKNRTLESILREQGLTHIDLLSMDIELGEPAALQPFPVQQYRPAVVCIEAQGRTRQWLLDYFARAGYVLLGDYTQIDRVNLYFSPLPATPPGLPSTDMP
jgi:FkbM family methyltransferase